MNSNAIISKFYAKKVSRNLEPITYADVAQQVEHFLGKEEVDGS